MNESQTITNEPQTNETTKPFALGYLDHKLAKVLSRGAALDTATLQRCLPIRGDGDSEPIEAIERSLDNLERAGIARQTDGDRWLLARKPQ